MLTCDRLAHRVGLAMGLPLLLAAMAAAPASAESDNGYGYLRTVEGSATLLQAESEVRTPAEINQPVLAGDRLIVPQRSKVEIILADRNLLRIDGGSEVVLERLAASPESRERATVLRLLEGNIQLVVLEDSLGEELPRIETPNATIFVQDFGVYRLTADQDIFTQLLVREGKAEIHTDRRSESVRADQQAFVEGDSRIDVEPAGSSDSLERWARRLDEEGEVDSRYVGDDLRYAAAPLSRHGSWIEHEGTPYWRPRGVANDWRPYWQGRWAHTPAGMTWVSYEPWGWVTSHYGSWDYVPTFGWAWRPGRTWAPAWVYWYWGPSYTGWCPVGYYTRYYGSRWGHDTGFHSGVYGWAGGDWGRFNHWTFVPANYFRGYRKGYRDGYWDGRRDGRWEDWREHRNVRRYAVPVDQIGHRGTLERGIVTTDTRPLTPDALDDPRRAVRVLSDQPTARRIGTRGERGTGELPDVTDFVARQPELPTGVRRVVVADGPDTERLAGTPLRPDTLGRGGETARRRARPRGGQPGEPGSDGVSSQPRIVIGDGDRPTSRPTARPSTPTSDGATGSTGGVVRSPRTGRPAQGEPGGAARPERPDRPEDRGGVRVPRDTDGGPTGGVVRSPRTGTRTTPSEPGGAPRPDRGVRSVPRATPRDNDNDGGGSTGSTGANPGNTGRSPRMGTRQTPSDPGGAPRPDRGTPRSGTTYRPTDPEQYRPIEPRVHRPTDPSGDRGTSSRPSTGSRRPEPRPTRPEASDDRNDSPSPRMSTPRYERPSPPSSSRGGYERPSSPPSRIEPRSAPRTESRQAPRSRSEAPSAGSRQAPERRPSVDRGSSSRGSEGSRGGSSAGSSGGSSRRAERSRGSGGRDN